MSKEEPIPNPIIGKKLEFYGCIIGLGFERGDSPATPDSQSKMLATFEDGDEVSVWEIPDHHLFLKLSQQLCDNALMRGEHDDYGIAKLAIQKLEGEWSVVLQ